MLKIPRYSLGAIDNEIARWDENQSGEWCKWEDVKAVFGPFFHATRLKWREDLQAFEVEDVNPVPTTITDAHVEVIKD